MPQRLLSCNNACPPGGSESSFLLAGGSWVTSCTNASFVDGFLAAKCAFQVEVDELKTLPSTLQDNHMQAVMKNLDNGIVVQFFAHISETVLSDSLLMISANLPGELLLISMSHGNTYIMS